MLCNADSGTRYVKIGTTADTTGARPSATNFDFALPAGTCLEVPDFSARHFTVNIADTKVSIVQI
jgi:hypothetical protein